MRVRALPLFIALFGSVSVVYVARRHERMTLIEHRLRPTTVEYFWLHPSYCCCTIQPHAKFYSHIGLLSHDDKLIFVTVQTHSHV